MRYLKYFESTSVDRKIKLLTELSYDLSDIGYEVDIIGDTGMTYFKDKILVFISHNNKDLSNDGNINEFEKTLQSYGLKYIKKSEVSDYDRKNVMYYTFDKINEIPEGL